MTEREQMGEPTVPKVWREASSQELEMIKAIEHSDPDLRNALIYVEEGTLKGWLTYKVLEPDDAEAKRHLYVVWWTVLEGARSPKAAAVFLSNFHDFLVDKHIDVVDFDVRDEPPTGVSLTAKQQTEWNRHRDNLIAVYSKLFGKGEYVPEIKTTMFSCTPEHIGIVARRGAIGFLFPSIPQ